MATAVTFRSSVSIVLYFSLLLAVTLLAVRVLAVTLLAVILLAVT